jgi:Protein of unknown function (DUF3311)
MMQRDEINRPSKAALLMGLIPFLAMCFSVPLWDRIFPRILGLPFNLFWLSLWIILSSGCMELARRLENKAKNMRDSR